MRIVILTALIALAGCASQNGAGTASPATADAPVHAVEAPVAQVASPAAASATAAPTTAAAEPEAVFHPPPGYKRRPDMGADIYCTRIKVLGSRFPKDDCRTEAQLRDLEQQRASARGEMDSRGRVCAGGGACQQN